MAVWALGINHHTAPLDMRGRFAFALDQIVPTLQGLRESLTGPGRQHSAVETAILSTCNRTEIYCAAEMPATDHTLHWHLGRAVDLGTLDRKSTRLNSSHQIISYAVFCLKKT